jgi:hypothetical protein
MLGRYTYRNEQKINLLVLSIAFRMFLVHSNNFDCDVNDTTTVNAIVKITTIIATIRLLLVTILTVIIRL